MWKLVAAFNQEKALVGAFSVIVQLRRLIVCSTNGDLSGDDHDQWPGWSVANQDRSLLLSPPQQQTESEKHTFTQNVLNIWKISLHITAWRLITWALQMSSRFSSLQSPVDLYNVQTGCIWKKNIYCSLFYVCHEMNDHRRKICFLQFYLWWTDLQGDHINKYA